MAKPAIFLDTGYVYGLLNGRDQWHSVAVEWQARLNKERPFLVTTQLVLVEIGNGLSAVNLRSKASPIIRFLLSNPEVEVVNVSNYLFEHALDLYEQRQDKDWGLTDCFSFVVMKSKGLTDALTPDNHFRQAGFRALLLD